VKIKPLLITTGIAFILSGCVSNPMSSISSSNDGIEKLSMQEIYVAGLYSKADDDLGLYDINFYKASDSSVLGYNRAERGVMEKIVKFCGNRKRSSYIGDRVKAQYMPIKASGSIGVFSDSFSLIFICGDSQFTKDNQNILTRFAKYYNPKFQEKYALLLKELTAEKARLKSIGDSIANSINRANQKSAEAMQRQYEINQMKPPRNTNCTVIGNQVNCRSY